MFVVGAPPKDSQDYVGTVYIDGIEFSDIVKWNKRAQMYKGYSGNLYKDKDIIAWDDPSQD